MKVTLFLGGTPGVGKTTIAMEIRRRFGLKIVEIGKVALDKGFVISFDKERGSWIVDEERLSKFLNRNCKKNVVFVSHYPLNLDNIDFVFILRLHPLILFRRLLNRRWNIKKICENVLAEILSISSSEFREIYENVYEINATGFSAEEVVNRIYLAMIDRRESGDIDWLEDSVCEGIICFLENLS